MKACLQAYINSTNIILKISGSIHKLCLHTIHSKQLTIRACNLGGLKADLKPLKYFFNGFPKGQTNILCRNTQISLQLTRTNQGETRIPNYPDDTDNLDSTDLTYFDVCLVLPPHESKLRLLQHQDRYCKKKTSFTYNEHMY